MSLRAQGDARPNIITLSFSIGEKETITYYHSMACQLSGRTSHILPNLVERSDQLLGTFAYVVLQGVKKCVQNSSTFTDGSTIWNCTESIEHTPWLFANISSLTVYKKKAYKKGFLHVFRIYKLFFCFEIAFIKWKKVNERRVLKKWENDIKCPTRVDFL